MRKLSGQKLVTGTVAASVTGTVARCQMKNERDNYRNWPVQSSHKVLDAKKGNSNQTASPSYSLIYIFISI